MPVRQALVAGFLPCEYNPSYPITHTCCSARVNRGLYREHEQKDQDPEEQGIWSACRISH